MPSTLAVKKPESGQDNKSEQVATLRDWIKARKVIAAPFAEMSPAKKQMAEKCHGHFTFLYNKLHFVDSMGNIATFEMPQKGAVAELAEAEKAGDDAVVQTMKNKLTESGFVHNPQLMGFMLGEIGKNQQAKEKKKKAEKFSL